MGTKYGLQIGIFEALSAAMNPAASASVVSARNAFGRLQPKYRDFLTDGQPESESSRTQPKPQ